MKKRFGVNALFATLMVVWASFGLAGTPSVEGVFGLSHVGASTAFAVWVPLEEDAAVEGVRWYNNDEFAVFPMLMAVAGESNTPKLMAQAISVATNVVGEESDWSEVVFSQPLASSSSGLYLIFRLPEDSAFSHEGNGGGSGFGYQVGTGIRGCWTTADGVDWQPFSPEYQMAVEPVMSTDKSWDILVLDIPNGSCGNERVTESEIELLEPKFGLSVWPNPFNPQTKIRFCTEKPGLVQLEIFDIRGLRVRTLVNAHFDAGEHECVWDGRDNSGSRSASGVYAAMLSSGALKLSTRLVLVK